jgi:hypothetical protein
VCVRPGATATAPWSGPRTRYRLRVSRSWVRGRQGQPACSGGQVVGTVDSARRRPVCPPPA